MTISGKSTAGNWSHLISRRAAHMLWYRLTWELFPEKSPRVTGMAATSSMSTASNGSVASHAEVVAEAGTLSVLGWNAVSRWRFEIDHYNARQLWAVVDVALYPAGWEGTSATYNKR